jgi:two-component sensor histidine kinase
LAVTLTELLQNAIEHAFPDNRSGTVVVELTREGAEIVAVVRDDGIGISKAAFEGERLGLQIVRSLVEELGGTFEITSEAGTTVELRVPVTK